jgi:hypothetical protein
VSRTIEEGIDLKHPQAETITGDGRQDDEDQNRSNPGAPFASQHSHVAGMSLYVNHVIHLAPGQAQSKAAADPETWSMFPGNVEIIS